MSDIVFEGPVFKRVDGAGWQEFVGQLVETGEIRLLKDGACAVSFQLAKSAGPSFMIRYKLLFILAVPS